MIFNPVYLPFNIELSNSVEFADPDDYNDHELMTLITPDDHDDLYDPDVLRCSMMFHDVL